MMRAIAWMLAGPLLLGGCCRAVRIERDVRLQAQHRDYWCWAAATEMLTDARGRRASQCDSVAFTFPSTGPLTCGPCGPACAVGWGSGFGVELPQMLLNLDHWGWVYDFRSGPLSWDELTVALRGTDAALGGPVLAVRDQHAVVVVGVMMDGDRRLVRYFDPYPPDCHIDAGYQCQGVVGGQEWVTIFEAFAPGWRASIQLRP